MPVTVERLPNEPILIATLSGNITGKDFKELYHLSTALIGTEPGMFYRISDVREAVSTFPEMLMAIQVAAQELPSSMTDERIHVTLVGTSTWINFARGVFAKRGITVTVFEEISTALESISWQIAHVNAHQPVDKSE